MTSFVCWNVFDEIDHLPTSVPAADRVIAGPVRHVFIDGRYPSFPGEHMYSTDGTAEFCAEQGSYLPYFGEETAKRTFAFHIVDQRAEVGDTVLILDADEELVEYESPSGPVGLLEFTRDSDKQTYLRARVFGWSRGMSVGPRHLDIADRQGWLADLTSGRGATVCGRGVHHDSCSIPRQRAKALYYGLLAAGEEAWV